MDNPESLRATLQQTSNSGYKALRSAHMGMVQINFYSDKKIFGSMPNLLDNILSAAALNTTPQDRLKSLLIIRRNLEELKSVAEKCQREALGVVNNFSELKDLMEEVQQACIVANTNIEQNQQQVEKKRKEFELQQKIALEKMQQKEEDEEARRQHQKETEKALKKSIKKLPGKLQLLGLKALAMFLDTFTKVSSNMTFGIAEAVEFILFSIKGKIPMEDKDLAQSLIKFKVEMAEKINSEAELKLQQAKKEREETLREYLNLSIQSAQLISQSQNELSVRDVLKSGIKLMGNFITNLKKMLVSLEMMKLKIEQTQTQILGLEGDVDFSEHNYAPFEVFDRIESINHFCLEIGYFSKYYVTNSKAYILPTIIELNRYAAISPDNIATERQKMIDSAERADRTINDAFEEKRNELIRKINESKQ